MRIRTAPLLVCLVMAGCASAGYAGPAPVPMYTESEAPCAYEVLRTVRVQTTASGSQREFESTRRRLLGRAAAQVGGDAVIVPDPGTGETAVVRPATGEPINISLEGQAVRWTEANCGGGA